MKGHKRLTLDTRSNLELAIQDIAKDAIEDARKIIRRSACAPSDVHNRHEAYGIAAEHMAKITCEIKTCKSNTTLLLGTLSDSNFPVVEAASSLVNALTDLAQVAITAAAEMKRTLDDLYKAETLSSEVTTPTNDEWDGGFEEAENIDNEEGEE